MAIPLMQTLRRRAGALTLNSALYDWSLGGSAPARLAVIPPDTWPGQAERGRWLTSGAFALDGETMAMDAEDWKPRGACENWLRHMHGFSWLRDLRALGGDTARLQARGMIASWLRRHACWDALAWQPELIGARLTSWIALYPFYGESAAPDFQAQLMGSLCRQARHLSRALPNAQPGLPALEAARGLAYAGLALEGREAWLEQALDELEDQAALQILPDGGHVSRSPCQLAEALRAFIDIRNALRAGQYPVPEQVEHTIDRMAQALRFFRGADKKLALFNGAREGDDSWLDAVMLQSNAKGRALRSLPHSGYERAVAGRTVLILDAGNAPPRDYDAAAHAAPLAFELSCGKEKIFTACGTHPLDESWQAMLRGTAAHNTLTIDHRNACEIRDDGHFGRRPANVSVERQEKDGAVLIDAAHDGYLPLNGIVHRRRFFMTSQGHDVRGEETLSRDRHIDRPVDIALRFHIHPRVQASLVRDGREALLRLPGGSGWRFAHSGGRLALEDSIHLGEDCRPRKTKQLVILGRMDGDQAKIKWALQREGA